MGPILVLVKPPTRRAAIESIMLLEQLEFDAIFIDLPRIYECYILDYLKHKNFEDFVRQISEITPPELFPISSIRGYEDIIRTLPSLAREKAVYCYGSDLKNKFETELSYLSAQLALHDIITEKVSVDKWLSILSSRSINFSKWTEEEAEYIATEASRYGKTICIAGYNGSTLKRYLSKYCDAWIKFTGQPFHFPPIQTLIRMMSIRKVDRQEVVRLIKEHIRFIKEFIVPYGLEDGLELWSKKKLYWLPHTN